ncbi:hypothetical protein CRX72_05630 [Pantoea sp. BRM17]|nr:hypothetical protein CRX72_05630 [Pantoea sp. BRM17]
MSRAQSAGLPKLGNISASTRGSPDDAQRAIAARASQAGAVYYQIVMLDETSFPGLWYATASEKGHHLTALVSLFRLNS